MALGGIGELLGTDHAAWNRVAVALAIYFAATALVLMFTARLPVLLLTPGLFALVGLMMLHVVTPPAQLVVWSEGTSGTQLARYQAWHQLSGLMRERTRARIPPQLSANAQPCDAKQTLRLDIRREERAGHDGRVRNTAFSSGVALLFRQLPDVPGHRDRGTRWRRARCLEYGADGLASRHAPARRPGARPACNRSQCPHHPGRKRWPSARGCRAASGHGANPNRQGGRTLAARTRRRR